MVELSQVSKIFYLKKKDPGIGDIATIRKEPLYALSDINLQVDAGDFMILTGPNGSGKTTLLKIIGGWLKPSQGKVIVKEKISCFINLPHGPWTNLPAKDFLLRNRFNFEESEKVLERSEISTSALVKDLSLGTQVKLIAAMILTNQSPIILLDDWFSVSDSDFQKDFFAEAQERTLILASHQPDSLKAYANKIIFLKNGKIEKESCF